MIRPIFAATLLGLFLFSPLVAQPGVTPEGDDAFLVFMANGVYDPQAPPPIPLSGDYFDSVIMGRSDLEKQSRLQDALDYFAQEFGVSFVLIDRTPIPGGDLVGFAIDPSSPSGINTDVLLVHSYLDTRFDYRAYVISDENVDEEGRVVHDASYALFVSGTEGTTFFGNYGGSEGVDVPSDTVVVHGEYLIEHPGNNRDKDIFISWRSSEPIFGATDPKGITFDCAMSSTRWGEGVALGRNVQLPVGDTGLVQAIIRNVISFPAPVAFH